MARRHSAADGDSATKKLIDSWAAKASKDKDAADAELKEEAQQLLLQNMMADLRALTGKT